jgi:hypothetical protein
MTLFYSAGAIFAKTRAVRIKQADKYTEAGPVKINR